MTREQIENMTIEDLKLMHNVFSDNLEALDKIFNDMDGTYHMEEGIFESFVSDLEYLLSDIKNLVSGYSLMKSGF